MLRNLLTPVFLLLFAVGLFAQENRAIDGSDNHPIFPDWGASHTTLRYLVPPAYADGMSAPAGMDRPNPREVSNTLFAQPGLLNDPLELSDYIWSFGQFIDHDVTFVPDTSEFFPIPVPAGDPWFDPFNTGTQIIPMHRSLFDPSTGTSPSNFRQAENIITHFIDGSAVYGSTQEHADWLRTFQDGKMKVSAGNFLPFNTITGELADPIDPTAPHMDNPVGITNKLFVAGDARVNEHPLLIGWHTLFVREHNRLCDTLAFYHPDWNDEQLYQYSRKIVGGLIQNVVYNEWLPAMGIDLPPYRGYVLNEDPRIINVFSAAAFRLGHTLLNPVIRRLDNDGNVIPEGNVSLKDAFFNPIIVVDEGGLEPLFKGMAEQVQQSFDPKVVDDVRNFLFGPPGAGGLDLASININRGRERGLPDFNTVRQSFGLDPYPDFAALTADPDVQNALQQLYGDISKLDPWVGMLAEDEEPGSLFGETIIAIMRFQFTALRDGDRFYFMNDPALDASKKNEIKNTRMVDIIRRNTDIYFDLMQDDVFGAMDHNDIPQCAQPGITANLSGWMNTEADQPIDSVKIEIFNGSSMMPHKMTAQDGGFIYPGLSSCYDYTVIPYKNDKADNGVNTLDLIKTQKHILKVEQLNTPYRIIAADANNSGHVSTADLIDMRKVILHVSDGFPNNYSWRFVPEDYVFQNPSKPLSERFPESWMFDMVTEDQEEAFIGIKVGDVDNTAQTVSPYEELPEFAFQAEDQVVGFGDWVSFSLRAKDIRELAGCQFTLNYDVEALDFAELTAQLPQFTTGNWNWMEEAGAITLSWDGETQDLEADDEVLTFYFYANKQGRLSDWLSLNSRYTLAEAYNTALEPHRVVLYFEGDEPTLAQRYELYQNVPNPVVASTLIGFYLPDASEVALTFYDAAGRVLHVEEMEGSKGVNQVRINRNQLGLTSGVLLYTLDSQFGRLSKKLIISQ